ncbi:MAG: M15 family metallopeptidase [bacterium]|nr:M15 family metallopeptidase [bacterium]
MPKKLLISLGVIILLTAGVFGLLKFRDVFTEKPESTNTNQSQDEQEPSRTEAPQDEPSGFNKAKYALDKPASPWWVVNKTRPLPDGYQPADLVVPDVKLRLGASSEQMKYSNQAVPDLKAMFADASENNVTLVFGSGFRSVALQRQFYNSYVAQDGQAEADRLSARPGTSEHQTGLSFDATSVSQQCHLKTCFEDLPEGKWLAANAHKYGFIIRYTKGKEAITGYAYEPWHMRWVGRELSTEMNKTGEKTLEEFFGLPAAPEYL